MKATLDERDIHALHFILTHYATEGRMPAQGEILVALGFAPSSHKIARRIFRNLAAAGFLGRVRYRNSFELIKAEYQYPADCSCGVCVNARQFAQLQLVQGLHGTAPEALAPKLRGLKPLHKHTKGYWLIGFPPPANRRCAQ